MKEKILAVLKTKYSNLGFDAKALDGVAASLAESVHREGGGHSARHRDAAFFQVLENIRRPWGSAAHRCERG